MSHGNYSMSIAVCPEFTDAFLSASVDLFLVFPIAIMDSAFYGNTPLVKMKLVHPDPQMKGE